MAATTALEPSFSSQRLPSTRPIDQRWDRSRGIIFSNAKRAVTTDHTWSSSGAIGFAQPSGSSRSYASRPITRPQPSQPPPLHSKAAPLPSRAAPSKASVVKAGGSDAHKFKNLGVSVESVQLRSTITDLEKQCNTLKAGLVREQEQRAREVDHLKRRNNDLEAQNSRLVTDVAIGNADAKAKALQHVQALEQLRESSDKKLEQLRKESDPARKENEEFIDSVRRAAKQSMEAVHKNTIATLKAAHDEHMAQVNAVRDEDMAKIKAAHDEDMAEMQRQHESLKRVNKEQEDRLAETANRVRELETGYVPGRKSRAEIDRPNYTIYRKIHNDVIGAIHLLRGQLRAQEDYLKNEARSWENIANEFENSGTLGLFRQMDKYKDTQTAILGFFGSKAGGARAAARELSNFHNELGQAKNAFGYDGHQSRHFTRMLHFQDELEPVEGMEAVYKALRSHPVLGRLAEAHQEQEHLEHRLTHEVDQQELATINHRLNELKPHISFLSKLVQHLHYLSKIAGLKTLSNESAVEKKVYLSSLEQSKKLLRVSEQYLNGLGLNDGTTWWSSDRRQAHVATFRQIDQEARRALEASKDLVRKRALLEEDLGVANKDDEATLDARITAEIKNFDRRAKAEWIKLAPSDKSVLTTKRDRMAASAANVRSRSLVVPVPSSKQAGSVISRGQTTQGKAAKRQDSWSKIAKWQTNVDGLSKKGRPLRELEISHLKNLMSKIASEEAKLLSSRESVVPAVSENVESPAAPEERENNENSAALRENIEPSAASGEKEEDVDSSSSGPSAGQISGHELRKQRREKLKRKSERKSKPVSVATEVQESADESGPGLNIKPTEPRKAHHARVLVDWSESGFATEVANYSTISSDMPALSGSELDPTLDAMPHFMDSRQTDQTPLALQQVSTTAGIDRTSSGTSAVWHASQALPEIADSNVRHEANVEATVSDDDASEAPFEPEYRMPPAAYRAAVMASPNTNAAFWSYKMYKNSEGQPPMVYYCKHFDVAEARAKLFLGAPVLGFDLEWEPQANSKSGIKHNISLIQIAAEDKIGLFHVSCFAGTAAAELLPPTLRTILEDAGVIKTGVNISGDVRRVKEYLQTDMKGVIELSHLYKIVKFSAHEPKKVNFSLVALAKQVQDVLLLPLKKDDNRMSHWSRTLNTQQSDYAASDAYAGFQLFHKLDNQRKLMKPTPPRPAFFETYKPLVLGDGTEVARTQRRQASKPVASTSSTKDVEEESEEFFDAVEELESSDEITNVDPATSGVIPEDSGEDIQYPALHMQDSFKTHTDNNAGSADRTDELRLKPSSSRYVRPDTVELRTAEVWATGFRTSSLQLRARFGELRAYHLWHEQGFSVSRVAAFMKEPPLTSTTVASYVMQCIKEEDLPFDADRLKNEVLTEIPKTVHWRYKKVLERIDAGHE